MRTSHDELFGNALWVEPDADCDTPLIRGEFTVDSPVHSAEITICGLGFFELYLNGTRVGEDYFLPLSSDYCARDIKIRGESLGEVFAHRLHCPRYNIGPLIKPGVNTLGVMLGPGWFATPIEGTRYGGVKLCYRILLQCSGGEREILSDDSLKWIQGPVVSCELFCGEEQNLSLSRDGWLTPGFDDSPWRKTRISEAPQTNLYIQDSPPDRIIRHLSPRLVSVIGSKRVYDAGENISGYPVLFYNGGESEEIRVRYSEELTPENQLHEAFIHNQQSLFITDGNPRLLHPKFTWHGFRYFEITGNAEPADCVVIHADLSVTSVFESDNELLNWFYQTYLRTQLTNMHCGIPTDCPHLERRGYTGDGQLTCEAALTMLDAKSFYKKWIGDISDCQDRISGHVQNTAPYIHSGGGPGGWGSAIVLVPYIYYRHFGEIEPARALLPQMLKYFEYLEKHSKKGLVVSDKKGEWCLGDWCTPEPIVIPPPFVNTYFYIKAMQTVLKIAGILNIHDYDQSLKAAISYKKKRLTEEYFSHETGSFFGGIQGADAFALDLGLGDERTLESLVSRYRSLGMYDTGIFGTDILTRVLFENGFGELAFNLITSPKIYSYQTWKDAGATTFREHWVTKRSHNHPMLGASVLYLFQYLAGIRQKDESAGFENVIIEPVTVQGVSRLKGEIETVRGRIGVEYEKQGSRICFTICKPPEINAVFRFLGHETVLELERTELVMTLSGKEAVLVS